MYTLYNICIFIRPDSKDCSVYLFIMIQQTYLRNDGLSLDLILKV